MIKKAIKVSFQKDNKKIKVVILPPTYKVDHELKTTYAVAYRKAITMGVATRSSMLELLKKEKIWGDEEEEKLIQKSIETAALEANLSMKTSDGDKAAQREAALKLVSARSSLYNLVMIKSSPLEHTAEAIAEDVRIDRFISLSTVFEDDGKPYFLSHEDFLNRRSDIDVIKIYNALIEELSKENLEIIRKLPENAWLMSNGLMDDNGNVKEKEFVDSMLVTEEKKDN